MSSCFPSLFWFYAYYLDIYVGVWCNISMSYSTGLTLLVMPRHTQRIPHYFSFLGHLRCPPLILHLLALFREDRGFPLILRPLNLHERDTDVTFSSMLDFEWHIPSPWLMEQSRHCLSGSSTPTYMSSEKASLVTLIK